MDRRHAFDRFETFRVEVNHRGDRILLRTSTTSGLTGLGDCSHSGNDARTVALVNEYLGALKNRSIVDVEWTVRQANDAMAWSSPICVGGYPPR
jgi:galactonate dehydratase